MRYFIIKEVFEDSKGAITKVELIDRLDSIRFMQNIDDQIDCLVGTKLASNEEPEQAVCLSGPSL